ncbi:hypothetical protein JXQ31_16705 [candidate division KSB1 bacterium]|nr:hypothetical protein [candidate division KSB1 bacterium]
MKSLAPWIFLSLFIHTLLTVIFMNINVGEPGREVIYFILEEDPEVVLDTEKRPEISGRPDYIKTEPKINMENKEDIPSKFIELKPPDSLVAASKILEDTLRPITHNRLFLIDTVFLSKPEYDKSVIHTVHQNDSLFLPDSLWLFKKLQGGTQNYDNVEDRIYQKSMGYPKPTVSIPKLLNDGANFIRDKLGDRDEDKPVRMDFLPSEKQLEALKIIWQKKRATDQSIYASFDTSIKITAADLNNILENLADRGLLKRKIKSPRNEFTFFGLTGESGIEMSPTNRRNRIYEYEPLISKEEMIDFLNAVFYQAKSGGKVNYMSDSDSLLELENIQRLLSRLY